MLTKCVKGDSHRANTGFKSGFDFSPASSCQPHNPEITFEML